MPRGLKHKISDIFYEFHRICMEIQDVSTRNYRTHIDNTLTNNINIKFLLGDFDETRWGQLLAKHERKRKRDAEVQEIFTAFRMVAVELINRIQNYTDAQGRTFTDLIPPRAEKIILELDVEIKAFIQMINDALRTASISHSYSVPYIEVDEGYYRLKTKNFMDEVKKKRGSKKNSDDGENGATVEDHEEEGELYEPVETTNTVVENAITTRRRPLVASAPASQIDESDEDIELQSAIAASLDT